jgi:multidrug efflux system outer membrane protein
MVSAYIMGEEWYIIKRGRNMGVFRYGFLFLFLSLALVSPGAEDPAGSPLILSPEQAVERALEQSLSLQKEFIDLTTAEIAADHLWAELFPSVNAGAEVSYGTRLFSGDGFGANQNARPYGISLGLSLQLNAGLPQAMKIIDLAYRSRLLNYQDARRRLAVQVVKDFYQLRAEERNLSLMEEIRVLAERQFEKNRIAFENGLLGQLALLQSRLSAETARHDLSGARTAYAARRREFLLLLGFDGDREIVLEGDMDILRIDADPEGLIRDYLAKRPDIISRRRDIERLEYVKKRTALSSRAPSLNLSARWGGSWPDFSDTLSGSVGLSVPVDSWIPGTQKSQAIRSAGADIAKARLDLKSAEDAAKSEIRSLAANLRDSWDGIGISRLRVSVAERTYELTEEGFQNGMVEFLTLEDARNRMFEARQRLLSDELAYTIITLDLSAALNIDWRELARHVW